MHLCTKLETFVRSPSTRGKHHVVCIYRSTEEPLSRAVSIAGGIRTPTTRRLCCLDIVRNAFVLQGEHVRCCGRSNGHANKTSN